MAVAFVTKNGGCAGQRPCTASGQTLRRLQAETLRTAVLSSGRGPIAHGTGKSDPSETSAAVRRPRGHRNVSGSRLAWQASQSASIFRSKADLAGSASDLAPARQ